MVEQLSGITNVDAAGNPRPAPVQNDSLTVQLTDHHLDLPETVISGFDHRKWMKGTEERSW